MSSPFASMLLNQLQHHVPSALVLTAFVTTMAYLRAPRAKVFIYSLPVPFSCAYIATQMPINATHVTGLMLVVGYNWLVFLLRVKARLPLLPVIGLCAGGYFLGAMLLRPLVGVSLLWAAGAALAGWLTIVLRYRPHHEPEHRSRSPWYVKAPLIFAIGMGVYNATSLLAGGVGMFPYAGIFASYEMRHSLRTLAGQFTINSLGPLACMLTIAATERLFPAPWPLVAGWVPVLLWVWVTRRLGLGKAMVDRPADENSRADATLRL